MKRPEKIILVSLDTLRADHLGCYGYKRDTSPFIDRFSKECAFFGRAFSTCSYTVPSHASMLTGKYPDRHSVGFHQKSPKFDSDRDISIAEILSDAGYTTHGIVAAVPLRADTGLDTGFHYYNSTLTRKNGRDINDLFKSVFKKDESSFYFLHFFDVHSPYIPPEYYNNLFIKDRLWGAQIDLDIVDDPPAIGKIEGTVRIGGIPRSSALLSPDGSVEKDTRFYIARYDGCIRYIDDLFSDLITFLKNQNIYDDSLIILTSDHGEAMGENNVWFYHALTVTPDQIHVPLLIKPHKCLELEPKTIETNVSLADLFPTICDLLGFDHSGFDIDGKSLVRLMENGMNDELEARTIISEIEVQIAYIDRDRIKIEPKKFDKDNLVLFYSEELCTKSFIYSTETFSKEVQSEKVVLENCRNKHQQISSTTQKSEGSQILEKKSRSFPSTFPESSLAHKYCIGKGLEIGGSAHNPFGLDTLNVDITDSMDTVFKKEEINLCGKALKVDIVASGDDISLLDESQDFIISSHVLEHFPNPIKALIEWDRLIKTGGIIFMIVPHKERTFDKCKNRTPLQHLIEDYNHDNATPHGDPNGHDHCWVTEDIVGLIDWMINNLNMKWELVEVSDVDDKVGNGFTIVIRKKGKRDCVIDLNEGLESFDFLNNPETLLSLKDACISNLESKLRKKDALISNIEMVIRDYKQELQQVIPTEQKTSSLLPAIESLLEMLEKEDISAELSVKAGEMYFSLGLYDSAVSFFNRAISIDSGNPEALNNLGVLNFQLQDYNAAKAFFIKALALDPDNKEAKINLALLSKTVNCAI